MKFKDSKIGKQKFENSKNKIGKSNVMFEIHRRKDGNLNIKVENSTNKLGNSKNKIGNTKE